MGLGKTVSMLALVAATGTPTSGCSCIEEWNTPENWRLAQGTLVVVPLSCEFSNPNM